MKKRNFAFATIIAASVFLSFAANSKNGGGWGSSNRTFSDRWNERFVVDTPSGSTSITVNTSSSTPSSTASDASYGSGTMTCRDTQAKIATDESGSSTSVLTIPEITHNNTARYACTSFRPQLYLGGMPVNSGNVDLKCSNGSLRVIASDCSAPPPPPPQTDPVATTPTPTPDPGGGGTTTPPANDNGCPAGNGYLSSNCGCCADSTTFYARTRGTGGKGGNTCTKTNTYFKTCTNGKYWYQNTGACSSVKPNAC